MESILYIQHHTLYKYNKYYDDGYPYAVFLALRNEQLCVIGPVQQMIS